MRDSERQHGGATPTAHGDRIDLDFERPGLGAFDWTPLGRAALWGTLAIAAAGVGLLSARSEAGSQRIAALFSAPSPAPQAASAAEQPAPTVDTSLVSASAASEVRQLAEQVRELAAEQARLFARLEAMERNLDVTAAIAKRPDEVAPAASTPPAVRPSRAMVEAEPGSAQFGLDLGPAGSLEALRAQWSVARAQHGAVLEGLRPLALIADDPQSGGLAVRLVIGPLPDAAAAARACAVIGATGRVCRPVPFEGQRLALR